MPAVYNFPAVRRGDTKTLVAYLRAKGIFSRQIVPYPLDGATVSWRLEPPGKDPIEHTGASGLTINVAEARIALPMSGGDTAAMPAAAVPYRIRITDSDGVITTHLTGTIPFGGTP